MVTKGLFLILDEYELAGEGFTPLVHQGEIVKVGQPLVRFNRQAIAQKGYDTTIMTIITESQGKNIILKQEGKVYGGDILYT